MVLEATAKQSPGVLEECLRDAIAAPIHDLIVETLELEDRAKSSHWIGLVLDVVEEATSHLAVF